MSDFLTAVIAFAGGFALAWSLVAWFVFLPAIGLLWLLGWLA